MGYKGKGRIIELEEPLPYPDGTRVEVTVKPEEMRKGSPKLILQLLAGTLTHEEAELIRKAVSEIRRIDPAPKFDRGVK